MKKLGSLCLLLLCCVSLAFADVAPLPMDDDSAGYVPNPEGIIDQQTYQDESIEVSVKTDGVGAVHCFIVYVKIKDPSQIRTAMSGTYESSRPVPAKAMSTKYKPIASTSGDFFKGNDYGYLIRQSTLYRERPDGKRDLLMIDNKGNFHTLKEPDLDAVKAYLAALPTDTKIINTFNFGPVLIKDGQLQEITTHLYSANFQHSRVAVAQLDELEYAIFHCEGKATGTFGMTMKGFANWIQKVEPRVKTAYNLDGGGSAQVYVLERKLIGNPNPRYIFDILYFASASDKMERVDLGSN